MNRLLIVDDEEGVRRSLKKVMEPEGYSVLLAENGRRAIDIVAADGDDIETVISDFRMPGMDGMETLVAIGRLQPDITRIILTGYATMETAIAAVNAHIDGFITKPFENAELKSKVREYNLKKRFRAFVADPVWDLLCCEGVRKGPKRQEVSILFCDIRGFSALVAAARPEELVKIMNSYYFGPMDEIIFSHRGTLDKHIGDSVMAIFGAPVADEGFADRAVACARDMMRQIEKVNEVIPLPSRPFSIGIGIATGEVMAGFFGSNRKREYTVLGYPVNLAARLEQQAGAGEILMCRKTWEFIGCKEEGRENLCLLNIDGKNLEVFRLTESCRREA
jgi:class 3 adenylate cyclase